MSLVQGETIVAIATAIMPQQGSVGIVRLSGAKSLAIAKTLFHSPGKQEWSSHRILYEALLRCVLPSPIEYSARFYWYRKLQSAQRKKISAG